MSYRLKLEQLILEGLSLRRATGSEKTPPSIVPWAAEAADVVSVVAGAGTALAHSATERAAQSKELPKEGGHSNRTRLIEEISDLLRRTLTLASAQSPEALDDSVRLKIINSVFKSWWTRSQLVLLTVTGLFLGLGIIKIGTYEINFDGKVRAAMSDVDTAASNAVAEIGERRSEALERLATTVGDTQTTAAEAQTKLVAVRKDVEDLDAKLRARLADDRAAVIAQLTDSVKATWMPRLDQELSDQRLLIQKAAAARVEELSAELAPEALANLGIIREEYGGAIIKLETMAAELETLQAKITHLEGNLDETSGDARTLDDKLSGLRADLEALSGIKAGEGARYMVAGALGMALISLGLAAFAVFRLRRRPT